MRSAVLFDLDGTLWDSARGVTDSWNLVLERRKLPLRVSVEEIHACMGKTMVEIADKLFPELADAERLDLLEDLCGVEVAYLREHPAAELFPGLEDTLRALRERGLLLAVVSNCQTGYIETFLKPFHMEKWFDDYEEWGRTGRPKGENIRLVMERNGVDRAVYVGDTAGDEAAARAAGVPFIHAAYGFGTAQAPDAVITALPQLPGVLDRLWGE